MTALVECSTIGVGRNIEVLCRLAEISPIHIVAPTGVYRDAYIPDTLRDADEQELADLWIHELTEGIEGTLVRAGFIKLAMSDDGPTGLGDPQSEGRGQGQPWRRAPSLPAIPSVGKPPGQEMDILEQAGLDLHRFIWVHAQTEPDLSVLMEAAHRGAWLELDSVGAPYQSQTDLLGMAVSLIEAGFVDQLLLSHDAGWYNPGSPQGWPEGGYRGYTALVKDFLPELLKRNVTEEQLQMITTKNPIKCLCILERDRSFAESSGLSAFLL